MKDECRKSSSLELFAELHPIFAICRDSERLEQRQMKTRFSVLAMPRYALFYFELVMPDGTTVASIMVTDTSLFVCDKEVCGSNAKLGQVKH